MTEDRRSRMKDFITENLHVRIQELERRFPDVSVMTIRRDLAALEEEGAIIRTRGGARINVQKLGMAEDLYSRREQSNVDAKRIISEKAVAFLEEKRSIYLDAGTTVMTLARRIPDRDLVLFTTAPNIALELVLRTQKPQVTLLGGAISRNTLAASGRASLEHLKTINIDVAFMATSAFSPAAGFTAGNPYEAELKAEAIRKSRRVIMLMTAEKAGRDMPYTFARMSDIDVLICEKRPGDDVMTAAAENGVVVL